MVDDKTSHILLDVRPSVELEICKLSNSDSFISILVYFYILPIVLEKGRKILASVIHF